MRALQDNQSPSFHVPTHSRGRTQHHLPLQGPDGQLRPRQPSLLPLGPPRCSSQALAFNCFSGENQAPVFMPRTQGLQTKLSDVCPHRLAGKELQRFLPCGRGGAVLSSPASLTLFSIPLPPPPPCSGWRGVRGCSTGGWGQRGAPPVLIQVDGAAFLFGTCAYVIPLVLGFRAQCSSETAKTHVAPGSHTPLPVAFCPPQGLGPARPHPFCEVCWGWAHLHAVGISVEFRTLRDGPRCRQVFLMPSSTR